jgi:hypothetical protein
VRAATLRNATFKSAASPPGANLRPLPDPEPPAMPVGDIEPVGQWPKPSSLPRPRPEGLDAIGEGEQVWVTMLDRELTRAQRSGSPLALLLLELEEAERLLAVEPPSEAAATFGRFAQTVRGVMRRQDILACESRCGWRRPGAGRR